MSFTSTGFVLFVCIVGVVYYIVPQKRRWIVLLVASYAFYALSNVKALSFIVLSTAVSFFTARKISDIAQKYKGGVQVETDKQKKKLLRATCKKEKKLFLTAGLIVCFGILVAVKYTNFFIENINALISLFVTEKRIGMMHLILPLGISFYTFQITSYLFDVYNEKYEAETNVFHYALYVSWFPAILQGPISRYNELKPQFFEEAHPFILKNIQFAIQRVLWGYLKKLVIADRAAEVVDYIFGNFEMLPWYITFAGLLFYSIELYADFSGGMDVVLGVSELLGIKLTENFRQPFFSQSISEFWRRWHITLGTWMKDYIFYPFSLSKTSASIGKAFAKISTFAGRIAPMCIANLLVFFIVGVWHGAEYHFIIYGLYNGALIVLGIIFKPILEKLVALLHINTASMAYRVFRTVRTFFLVNVGWVFDDVSDLRQSFCMLRQLFSFKTGNLISNFQFLTFSPKTIFTVLLFCLVWLIVSIQKERGCNIRECIASWALPVRWAIYLALILSVPFFQAANMAGFIYAQF